MVRFSFIISLALAAQGLQAAPSESRGQVEPRAGDASQLAQDGVTSFPVLRLDKRAEGDKGEDGCEPDGVTNGGQDNKSKRPVPTGFPSQAEEEKFQKDRQRGKTKHEDAEAQRAKEKAEQDAAREDNKQTAIDRDAEAKKKAEEEARRKEERKKAFKEAEKKTEDKKATGHQDANKEAQKIVDDGQKNCKEGGSEEGCNKPLPTQEASCSD